MTPSGADFTQELDNFIEHVMPKLNNFAPNTKYIRLHYADESSEPSNTELKTSS